MPSRSRAFAAANGQARGHEGRPAGGDAILNHVHPKEESLLIYIPLSDLDLGSSLDDDMVDEVESTLCRALASNGAGTWDGHEFGAGWATIFLYGASADDLFDCVAPALLTRELPSGSVAIKQYRAEQGKQIVRLSASYAS